MHRRFWAAPAALVVFTVHAGCGLHRADSGSAVLSQPSGDVLTEAIFWNHFVFASRDPRYQGYIKFTLVLDGDGVPSRLILHPASFAYHADHLTTLPEFRGMTSQQIESIALRSEGRRILLGTFLLPSGGGVSNYASPWNFHVELLSNDSLTVPFVAQAFSTLKALHGSALGSLLYAPVGAQRAHAEANRAAFESAGVPIASNDSGTEKICYTPGWGVGRVRILNASELERQMRAGLVGTNDILVLDEVPRELPMVAGVVVARESSPSSHVALMAQMAGSPFIFEKDAPKKDLWQRLAGSGEAVFVSAQGSAVTGCQVVVRGSSSLNAAEAQLLMGLRKPRPLDVAPFDRSPHDVLDLASLSIGNSAQVGAKAAHVAELMRIIPQNTISEGRAIPISFFAEALERGTTAEGAPLRAAIDSRLLRISDGSAPLGTVLDELEAIRKLIEKSDVPPDLEGKIDSALKALWPAGTRLKFRSSSNVEDNPDFNGAGLYESKGACLGDVATAAQSLCDPAKKPDPVLSAIRKVWASLYTPKGFLARQYFGVKESFAGMGILVQRSYKGELANGVLITANDSAWGSAPGDVEVTMTGFPGEDDSVTNPPAGKTPETTSLRKATTEVLIPSSEVPRGRNLLSEPLYREMQALAQKVHNHYLSLAPGEEPGLFRLDMEWKVVGATGAEKVILKQVRRVPGEPERVALRRQGAFVIGERGVEMCPFPQENADGLGKLLNSTKVRLSVGMVQVPFQGGGIAPNSIERFEVWNREARQWEVATANAAMEVTSTPWSGWGGLQEHRSVTTQANLTGTFLGGMSLAWTHDEERIKTSPDFLLRPVLAISELYSFYFRGGGVQSGSPYRLVVPGTRCEADAYQGYLPGVILGDGNGEYRVPPHRVTSQFPAEHSGGISLSLEGRSALQGVDKTMQIQIDSLRVRGLLSRELEVTDELGAVYAPAHHNFGWQYAVDLYVANSLAASEKSELKSRGIRYLVWPKGEGEETGLERRGEKTFSRVVGVAEDGVTETFLGWVEEVPVAIP